MAEPLVGAIEHTRPRCGHVGVVGERVPCSEHEIVSAASGTKSWINGRRLSVRLPRRIVPI